MRAAELTGHHQRGSKEKADTESAPVRKRIPGKSFHGSDREGEGDDALSTLCSTSSSREFKMAGQQDTDKIRWWFMKTSDSFKS